MTVAWNIKAVICLADSLDSVVKPDLVLFFFDEAGIWHYVKSWLIKSFIVKPNSQLFGPNPAEER